MMSQGILQNDREVMQAVNDSALRIYQEQLWHTEAGKEAMRYLTEVRVLDENTIRRFQLGYAPAGNIATERLKAQGYEEKYLLNDAYSSDQMGTGLCLKSTHERVYDRFHGRIVMPFYKMNGKIVGFGGRLIGNNPHVGKYINSPTSPLFDKRNELFGLYQAKSAIMRCNECILVEGQFDVMSLSQAGIENVVTACGTSVTREQLQQIRRFTNELTLIFDGDRAGMELSLRMVDLALAEQMHVRALMMPEDVDPDNFVREHSSQEVCEYIQNRKMDGIAYKIKVLMELYGNDVYNRAEIVRDVVRSIRLVACKTTQTMLLREASELLQMDEAVLLSELTKEPTTRICYHQPYYEPRHPEPPKSQPHVEVVSPTAQGASELEWDEENSLPF